MVEIKPKKAIYVSLIDNESAFKPIGIYCRYPNEGIEKIAYLLEGNFIHSYSYIDLLTIE